MKKQESVEKKHFSRCFSFERDEQQPSLKQEKKLPTSDYTGYYLQAMEKITIPSKRQLIENSLERKFYQGDGVYSKRKQISFKKNNSYLFSLGFGDLFSEISFLKTRANLNFIYTQHIDAGAYGKIYLLQFQHKNYVVKSQRLINTEEFLSQKFINLLKEYFCAKLASCLKIGPKVESLFGYDILIHGNSFEFVMEYCGGGIIDTEKMKKDLMENLKIMHSLGIVHMDIKPENIGWSNEFKKWVFLDFGFARFLDAKIGQKSETGFIGTFNYASKEMKQLYHLQKKGFVDLYYNDLFSLEESLKNIQSNRTTKVKNYPSFYGKEKINTTSFSNSVLSFLKIKFDLFRNHYQQIPKYLGKIDQFTQCLPEIFLNQMNEKLDNEKVIWSLYIAGKNQQLNPQKKKYSYYQNEIKRIFDQEQPLITEWEPFKQFLGGQNQIKNLLKQNWGKIKFMEKTFDFFQKTLFHENERLNQKNKSLRNFISEQIFPETKGKSSFWRLRYILSKFEQFFLEEYNVNIITKIIQIYTTIGDLNRGFSLTQKQKYAQKSFFEFKDLFWQFFENNNQKTNRDKCIQCLKKISSIPYEQQKFIRKKQKQIIIQIMNKVFEISQKQNVSQEDHLEIENIMQEYSSSSFGQKSFYEFIFFYVEQWSRYYQILHNSDFKYHLKKKQSGNQKNRLSSTIQKIKKLMIAGTLNQMVKTIEQNIFILQIPSIFNIQYYEVKREKLKMKQMIKDFQDLMKHGIQFYYQYFSYLVLKNNAEHFSGASLILDFFIQFSVSQLNSNRLSYYEQFFNNVKNIYKRLQITQKQKQILKEKICLILKEIIFCLQKQKPEFETFLSIQYFKIQMKKMKGEIFQLEFMTLFEDTMEKRKGWVNPKQKLLLRNLCQLFSSSEGEQKLALKRLIFQHNNSLSEGEKNWTYLDSNSLFLQTLIQAYGKDFSSLKSIYQVIKNHSDFLSNTLTLSYGLEKVLHKFIDSNQDEMLIILAKQICLDTDVRNVRDNFYLSGLFYLFYRRVKQGLSFKQKKRLLVLSMLNIDFFPFLYTRGSTQRSLVLEYKLFNQFTQNRKKLIHSKRVAYAKRTIEKWQDKIQKNLNFYKMNKRVWEKYLQKLQNCQNNFKRITKQNAEADDEIFEKK